MRIAQIIEHFEQVIPVDFQESYDNCGLQVGNAGNELSSALITLDISERVLEEAIEKNCNLIISHHPLIFQAIKKITGANATERILQKALKSDVCIYCAHTSLDNNFNGLNTFIAGKIGLQHVKILEPAGSVLKKLVVFCPVEHAEKVRTAIFSAGAGHIGNYDCCSFNGSGAGSFRANENARPFVGELNELHFEPEIRIETIFPDNIRSQVIQAMLEAHPYEEVAYDIYPLDNLYQKVGSGIIGELLNETDAMDFIRLLKDIFKTGSIRYNKPLCPLIRKVALCGGSGSFLIKSAMKNKADILVTADIKYHDFFNEKIMLADVGHFESEYFSAELIASIITKKFPTFAFLFSEQNINPVHYF
ncbi:MAG TPA: Nif3-like dinuclear metal center hexameric protein [Bacteroidales bacterium]|nr:Nif3-like dinuclear metal center hexameric protein [Bacteroidales bacterium]